MLHRTRTLAVSILISLFTLSCGGGGGGGETPPAAPSASLSYGIKTLEFTWPAVAGATHYRLLENPDGVSGFTQVGSDITTTSVSHTIALHRRVNASYIVAACNSGGCTNSTPITLAANLVPAIGYVKASNTGVGDRFGITVALSADGNTLAVGAFGEGSSAQGIGGNQADNAAANAGAVYIFIRSGSTWTQQAYVKASNTGAGDYFGAALALAADGNTLAVGAELEDSSATGVNGNEADNAAANAGAAYVFTRSGTTWSQQAYVKASNTGADDRFGRSVALSADGNALVIGAFLEDSNATGVDGDSLNNSVQNSGAVYVFTRTGGSWAQQAYVKPAITRTDRYFGGEVAISADGSTLAVGAAIGEISTVEAVEVFTRSGGTWSQQAYLQASNTEVDDFFGSSLVFSADGNTLAVGAVGEASNAIGLNGNQADNSALYSGAVYVFTRSGNNWTQQTYVKASNTEANDGFGTSVSLSADGNTLAIGASGESSIATGIGGDQADNSAGGSGAVYLY